MEYFHGYGSFPVVIGGQLRNLPDQSIPGLKLARYSSGFAAAVVDTEADVAALTFRVIGATQLDIFNGLSIFYYPVGVNNQNPTSPLHVNGSVASNGVVVVGNTTLTSAHSYVNVNKGSAAVLTLPAASTCDGREYDLQVTGAFAVTSASSNVIPKTGGAASSALLPATSGAWCTIKSVAGSWRIIRSGT